MRRWFEERMDRRELAQRVMLKFRKRSIFILGPAVAIAKGRRGMGLVTSPRRYGALSVSLDCSSPCWSKSPSDSLPPLRTSKSRGSVLPRGEHQSSVTHAFLCIEPPGPPENYTTPGDPVAATGTPVTASASAASASSTSPVLLLDGISANLLSYVAIAIVVCCVFCVLIARYVPRALPYPPAPLRT